MEAIREVIEWIANDSGSAAATLTPYLLLGLAGLYVLWLVIGYLRVSQVKIHEGAATGDVLSLPEGGNATARPRGVPYCAFDGLQYPPGARFCTVCERDLSIDCANCGATLQASDTSCYRCGTPTTPAAQAEQPLLT